MTALLGILAGLLTTLAGMGGGMVLTLALAAWWADPLAALVVSTPALWLGNVHRTLLYRRELDWGRALAFGGAALPGALLGGLLAVAVPPWLMVAGMTAAAGAAVAQHRATVPWTMGRGTLVPAGLGIGVVSATGGAGLLAGPVLIAAGLSGGAYLATLSLSAVSMHTGRMVAFAMGGAVTREQLALSVGLALCIMLGNTVGRGVRGRLSDRVLARMELGTCCLLVGLALVALGRSAL